MPPACPFDPCARRDTRPKPRDPWSDALSIYLLAKPVPRRSILLGKLAVALATTVIFAVLPIIAATALAGDEELRLSTAYGLAALLAGIAYTTVFVALSVLTRNAVIVGLLYALLWESVLGGYVPGVRNVSVRQWALAPAEELLGFRASGWGVESAVTVPVGVSLLVVVVIGATWWAVARLKTLRLAAAD